MAIPMHRGLYLIRELELHVLFGRFPAALAVATRAEALLSTMPNFMQVADYAFFHAIALARSGIREGLVEHERRLWQWAEGCPANFEDRAALVSAEIARLDGRESDARALYERAIHAARKRGRTHVEALAYELAAEFYEALGYGPFARAYREEARNAYQRWGAVAKVHDLEQRHPALARPPAAVSSGTFAAGVSELNLLSVAKASQSISREIVPGDLARTLLRVVLEQSGAQRGCLILVRDRGAAIVAEALARDGVQVSLLEATPVSSSVAVPRALVERVLRTRQRAVIEDAAAEPQSIGDTDYAARFRPKSALCIPILRQARAVGCLYLENSLVTGSFTPERLEVLDLLASQAAISLDNAYLLERELAARRAAEQSRERAAFLAEVGSVLSESLDLDVVLERVARAVVRSFADWVAFDLVEDGQIRRRAGAHRYPERAPLLEELARRYPPSWDSPHASIRRAAERSTDARSESDGRVPARALRRRRAPAADPRTRQRHRADRAAANARSSGRGPDDRSRRMACRSSGLPSSSWRKNSRAAPRWPSTTRRTTSRRKTRCASATSSSRSRRTSYARRSRRCCWRRRRCASSGSEGAATAPYSNGR